MARSLDEVRIRPAEATQAFEYQKTEETPPLPPERIAPQENQTFAFDEVQAQPVHEENPKAKKLTVAAAVFAAAGITLFAGIAGTAELLRMQTPPETTAVTETAESTEASVPVP